MHAKHDSSVSVLTPLPDSKGIQQVEVLRLNYAWSPPLGPCFKVLPWEREGFVLTDEFNHRVLKFDASGELNWQTGGKGSSSGRFCYPRGMALLGGLLYVCDSWNHRVQVLDPQGRVVNMFGTYGSKPGQFNECSDIEVDGCGRLWVVDTGNHCLRMLTPEGRVHRTIGHRLSVPEEGALYGDADSRARLASTPGFCYPRRFLCNYQSWFCIDDRGNRRCSLIGADGTLAAAMDTRTHQVISYLGAEEEALDGIGNFPAVFPQSEELQVVGWDGRIWQRLPAARYTEVHGCLLRDGENHQILLSYCNCSTQDLIQYRMVFNADREAALTGRG